MGSDTIRTTITLPAELLEAADQVVREGGARSRNQLIADALRQELAARERAAIDAAFAALANDQDFHDELVAISEEGAAAGWEALRLAEAGE
jgi:metal-responsive CopG/Arc/MetJ family transcriptional regulator